MEDKTALLELLREHWVLALATRDPGDPDRPPYSTPLFYALLKKDLDPSPAAPVLVFAGKDTTTHGTHLGEGPTRVSGSVYLETEEVGKIRGVQLEGVVVRTKLCSKVVARALRNAYLKRHPVAAPLLALPSEKLYAFVIVWAKVTDNRFGFGVRKTLEYSPDWEAIGCPPP